MKIAVPIPSWLVSACSVLAFFLIWEAIGRSRVIDPLFISSPSAIVAVAGKVMSQAEIYNDLYVSGVEFALGFLLAIVVGIPLGLATGWYRTLNSIFRPFVSALNATPRVALLPVLIIWLGIGIWSKVAIVFLGALFPLIINAELAVRTLDETLLRVARSFGARDWQIFRTITLPSSVPFVLAGMRIGVGRALVGIVVGELVAATAGIGYFMALAGATFQTDKLFLSIFIITAVGVALTELLEHLERRFQIWRPSRFAD